MQDAQTQAAQALKGLLAVISSPSMTSSPQSTYTKIENHSLACFEVTLQSVMAREEAEAAADKIPGVNDRRTDLAVCHQAAQVALLA